MEGSDGERPSTHGLIKDKDAGCRQTGDDGHQGPDPCPRHFS